VNQCRGLEGVPGGFAAKVVRGETMQLLVDHGEHLIQARLVAPAPIEEPLGDGALGGSRIVRHAKAIEVARPSGSGG
jgi:hypothetical protein